MPDWWSDHGLLALVCIAVFPRLTLLFGSFATGGLLWWLGWLFAPHLLVAILALSFWDANPYLVIAAWIVALIGTGGEAGVAGSGS
jgi:hypothetical protein